jgi:hypothetical protein
MNESFWFFFQKRTTSFTSRDFRACTKARYHKEFHQKPNFQHLLKTLDLVKTGEVWSNRSVGFSQPRGSEVGVVG